MCLLYVQNFWHTDLVSWLVLQVLPTEVEIKVLYTKKQQLAIAISVFPCQDGSYQKRRLVIRPGRYKTWTVDSGLDHELDYGPAHSSTLVHAE